LETVVLSVGGSIINPGTPDLDFLKTFAKLLVKLSAERRVAVVCGGGKPARDYAKAIRSLGAGEFAADESAILLTRANATLLLAALGDAAYPGVMDDFESAARASTSSSKRIFVMGGTIPGITTDTDAALLAEKLGARKLFNLSNVDALYDRPPNKPGAKRLTSMSHAGLIKLANEYDLRRAGMNFVFDIIACKIVARSKVETHFVDGKNFREVEAAISGKKHAGTVVKG